MKGLLRRKKGKAPAPKPIIIDRIVPTKYLPETADEFDIDELERFTAIGLRFRRGSDTVVLDYAYGLTPEGHPVRVRIDVKRFGRKTYRSELRTLCEAVEMNPWDLGVWEDDTYYRQYS